MMEYAVYDVFTGQALAGNPLAVVFGADGLDATRMGAIAKEFNLSETVFIRKAEHRAHSAALRIFTPDRELPFAGHPTVGAAVAVAERGAGPDLPENGIDLVEVFEEQVGLVRCAVRLVADAPGFAEFDIPKLSERIDIDIKAADVAAALGIGAHEIGFENHRLSAWSAGVPFVAVPVHDLSVAAKIRCNAAYWREITSTDEGEGPDIYTYCRGGEHHRASFHARMFAPGMGIIEDPATGAAVAALSGAIQHFDGLSDGRHALMIEQGVEMGRTSHIHLHLDCAGGAITAARIGGQAVKIAEGRLFL